MNTTSKVCIASWAAAAVILSTSAWVMVFGQQQVAADHQAALERVAAMEAAQPPLVNSDGTPVMEQSVKNRSSIPVVDNGAMREDIRRATSALNEQISAAEEEIRQLRAALDMKL